ncbi:MAG TPA: farnesyl diphosphate synthase [Pyrinomonadaceae bacterium]|nr:farnesyl diphosphate synthase [Pyrinomonadaceae bacterium]
MAVDNQKHRKIDNPNAINDNHSRMSELKDLFDEVSRQVNAELDWLIPAHGSGPQNLRDAMRWSLFAGGKHFRPALVFAVGRTFGADDEQLVRTAAAIEMIHTYSLIHDDLPSMDDDDLRRGRETCHKRFGEATAILAGDALQVLSFQAIGEEERLSESKRIKLLSGLARAAAKMVVGQQLDLEAEGKPLSLKEIENIHTNKTGALIEFSAYAGAVIAEVSDEKLTAVSEFASKLGLLFQITDDLLDRTQTTEQLGKTAGKDVAAGKATYPGNLGIEETRAFAREIYDEAKSALAKFDCSTRSLEDLSTFLLTRYS